MTDHHIQASCRLLKELEKEISTMRELMRQLQVVSHNMEGTWTAIHVTQGNWRRDLEEDFFREGFRDESSHP